MEINKTTNAILGILSVIAGGSRLYADVKSSASRQPEKNHKQPATFSEAWGQLSGVKRIDCILSSTVATVGMLYLSNLASRHQDKTHGFAGALWGAVAGFSIASPKR